MATNMIAFAMRAKKNNTRAAKVTHAETKQGPEGQRIRANVRLARLLREKLAETSLDTQEMISSIAVDLADIATIGERHNARLQKLLHLRFPQDLEKLEDLLIGFEVDLLWENQWHLKSLKRQLPKLLQRLDECIRKPTNSPLCQSEIRSRDAAKRNRHQ